MTATIAPRRALVPYCIVTAAMSLGYGSIYTLLADLRDRFGFTGTQLGLIVAAGFFAGFVAQLGLARYADRGHVALLVRGGVVAASLAMVASALATSFGPFVAARALLGLGSGAVGPAIRRVVVTRDPDRVGANLGLLASFDVAGFVLGPLAAAVTAEVAGLRAPFWLLGATYLAVLALSLRLDLATAPAVGSRRVLAGLLRIRGLQATLAMAIAFYVTIGMFEAIWAVLLRDQGAATWLIGLTLSLFSMPMIVLAPLGGRSAQRRGPLRVVAVSLSVALACTLSYGILPSLALLLVVSLVHAVADSFTMPGNQVGAALASPPEHVSSAQGLLGATGLAAAGLAGLGAGFAYEEWGRLATTASTAAVMAAFVALGVWRGAGGLPAVVARADPPPVA